jgi:hypothetical protein
VVAAVSNRHAHPAARSPIPNCGSVPSDHFRQNHLMTESFLKNSNLKNDSAVHDAAIKTSVGNLAPPTL